MGSLVITTKCKLRSTNPWKWIAGQRSGQITSPQRSQNIFVKHYMYFKVFCSTKQAHWKQVLLYLTIVTIYIDHSPPLYNYDNNLLHMTLVGTNCPWTNWLNFLISTRASHIVKSLSLLSLIDASWKWWFCRSLKYVVTVTESVCSFKFSSPFMFAEIVYNYSEKK